MKIYYNELNEIYINSNNEPLKTINGNIQLNPAGCTDLELYEQCGLYLYEQYEPKFDEYLGELIFNRGKCYHKIYKKDIDTIKGEKLQELEDKLDEDIRIYQFEMLKNSVTGIQLTRTLEEITNEYNIRKKEIEDMI